MAKMSNFLKWETHTTPPKNVNGIMVQLESKALSLQFPGGGYVWNRPTAVYINQNNQIRRIPITDITRNALWTISGITILISILAWLRKQRLIKKEQHHEQKQKQPYL